MPDGTTENVNSAKTFDEMTEAEQRNYIKIHMKSKEGYDSKGYGGTIYYLPKDEEAGITEDTTVAMKRSSDMSFTSLVGVEDNPINTDSDLINTKSNSTTENNGTNFRTITQEVAYIGKVKIADLGEKTSDNVLDPELFN